MLGPTHMMAGALSAAVVLQAAGAPAVYWVPCLAAGAVAGLLPDIDLPGSTAGRAIPGYRGLARGDLWALLGFVALALWAVPRYVPFPVGIPPTIWLVPAAAAVALLAVSFVLQRYVTHRGPTHSILAAALFAAGVHAAWRGIPTAVWWSLTAGYASHILIDLFNIEGAALLWPLSRRKWSVRDSALLYPLRAVMVRTGSPGEVMGWRPALMVLLIGIIVWHFAGGASPAIHFLRGDS